ncbi:DUF3667 domain-containing protein [Oceanihabitans sp. 2_MG-2023]|uniref:DUF3667 domain-containing protein n=1 Tax=Oceanihabitans sp. 2_MG-2023 TaxID=3062661 RepID=UPI0026E402F1|nr:DUF3667 domain-containing protein [Oceanihabitans sp. 2_MG-2023]MDO6597571.1 DUF3667 domain-containing protein [Oceanihabitans sp. 2_MG-2023]
MTCKNCYTALKETDDYCNSCGAKVIRNRLTIRNLFEHFSETFFNYDNKLLRTFISLFTKPEDVIGGYINGVRKKYVNVISYFALALTLLGLQMFILNKFFPNYFDFSSLATNGVEDIQKQNMDFIIEYQSFVMMLYIPLYAIISKLVFYNLKKFNYTEHIVIFMYVLAQTSIIGSVVTVLSATFGLSIFILTYGFILPFQILYSAYCLKKIFKLRVKEIIARTLLFLIILIVLFVLIIIIVIVFMIFSGGFEEMKAAQKAVSLS